MYCAGKDFPPGSLLIRNNLSLKYFLFIKLLKLLTTLQKTRSGIWGKMSAKVKLSVCLQNPPWVYEKARDMIYLLREF